MKMGVKHSKRKSGEAGLLLASLFLLLLNNGCSLYDPKIEVVCNELGLGYYQLVWETTPTITGKVKVYISESPTQFKRLYPNKECDIADNTISVFLPDSYKRKYFLLVFNNKHEVVVSNRIMKFDGITNFRDIGGYETHEGRRIRWGMLYRSGIIQSLSRNTLIRLGNLRPYTIIDLSGKDPMQAKEIPDYPNIQYVHLPVEGIDAMEAEEKLRNNEFKRGDALLLLQDLYRAFADNNHNSLEEIFTILANPQNYPVIIEGEHGKDKVSFVIALLLHLLHIPDEQIMDDFLLSNTNLDYFFSLQKEASRLSPESQEAITILHTSNQNTMKEVMDYIDHKYGSVDKYMESTLKIDKVKRKSIQNILLVERQN